MVDGAEYLIWLGFLSAFSHLQLIQNLAPSTICWCQCDIRIEIFLGTNQKTIEWESFGILATSDVIVLVTVMVEGPKK